MPIIRSYNCSSRLWFTYCHKRYCFVNLQLQTDRRYCFAKFLPEAATAVVVASDDGHEDAQNM